MGNNKFTGRQIALVVFLICLVIIVSTDVKQGIDVYSSVQNNSGVFTFVALIIFATSIVSKISIPTKEKSAMIIKSRFSFLEDLGFFYSRYTYNKKQKALEVYFSNPDFVDICVVYFYKLRTNNVFMVVGNEYVNFRSLEDMYCKKISDKERNAMTVEEYITFVINGVEEHKEDILRIQSCYDFINGVGNK